MFCAVLAVMVGAIAGPDAAKAQFRIKLGNDLKPRIEFNQPDDRNQGGNQQGNVQPHVEPDYRNQGGVQRHVEPEYRNWVIKPQVQPGGDGLQLVIGNNAKYVIRDPGHDHHGGAYYCKGDRYYYVPQPVHQHEAPRPVVVQFGAFSHVDELALRLETLMNELCLDLHYNYGHNYGFQETYAEAYQVLDAAKFVHAAEHRNDRQAIRQSLGGMDSLFHHVQEDVRSWTRHHRRQIGQGGMVTKLEAIESTLHHLMNDVGVHPTSAVEQAPPPAGYIEQAPPPSAPGVGTPTPKVYQNN
jgi:hypothetical protein